MCEFVKYVKCVNRGVNYSWNLVHLHRNLIRIFSESQNLNRISRISVESRNLSRIIGISSESPESHQNPWNLIRIPPESHRNLTGISPEYYRNLWNLTRIFGILLESSESQWNLGRFRNLRNLVPQNRSNLALALVHSIILVIKYTLFFIRIPYFLLILDILKNISF